MLSMMSLASGYLLERSFRSVLRRYSIASIMAAQTVLAEVICQCDLSVRAESDNVSYNLVILLYTHLLRVGRAKFLFL